MKKKNKDEVLRDLAKLLRDLAILLRDLAIIFARSRNNYCEISQSLFSFILNAQQRATCGDRRTHPKQLLMKFNLHEHLQKTMQEMNWKYHADMELVMFYSEATSEHRLLSINYKM